MPLPLPDRQLLGKRLSIRLRVPEGGFQDIVGILESETTLRKRDGALVEFQRKEIAAWRKVELVARRAGKGAPLSLRIREIEIIAAQTWPARVQEEVGEWVMRATGKFTMRANSVLVLGDPGIALDEALNRVCAFYAEHDAPPLMHIPLPTFRALDDSLESRGWVMKTEVLVMVIDISPRELSTKPECEWSISESFDDEWLQLQNDFGVSDIMRSVPASYASLKVAGQLVAVGRSCNFGEWTVLTRLFVHPEFRRKGIGAELLSRLLNDAAKKGATMALLQVDAKNAAAIRIYEDFGFKTHHSYCYRILPPATEAGHFPETDANSVASC